MPGNMFEGKHSFIRVRFKSYSKHIEIQKPLKDYRRQHHVSYLKFKNTLNANIGISIFYLNIDKYEIY